MNEGISAKDIKLGKWYQVLIGYSEKPEIRSGYCVDISLKGGMLMKVLGECGTITNTESYIKYIDSHIYE